MRETGNTVNTGNGVSIISWIDIFAQGNVCPMLHDHYLIFHSLKETF